MISPHFSNGLKESNQRFDEKTGLQSDYSSLERFVLCQLVALEKLYKMNYNNRNLARNLKSYGRIRRTFQINGHCAFFVCILEVFWKHISSYSYNSIENSAAEILRVPLSPCSPVPADSFSPLT